MAKGKPPEKSKIERERPLAYSRRQKGKGDEPAEGDPEAKPAEGEGTKPEAKPAEGEGKSKAKHPEHAEGKAKHSEHAEGKAKHAEGKAKHPEGEHPAEAEAKPADSHAAEAAPPEARTEPWPDATPQPMRPVEPAPRARAQTVAMSPEVEIGGPPSLPEAAAAAPPPKPGDVEDPTYLPGPKDIPGGNVTDPALPPGRVPSGDSRSLRKANEFALIYRLGTAVITRSGTVGTRGVWRVVEYPTSAFASNSYAKEVSRFVGEGFSDYRD